MSQKSRWMGLCAVLGLLAGATGAGADEPPPPPFVKGETELGLSAGASLPLGAIDFEGGGDEGTFDLRPGPVFSGHVSYALSQSAALGISLGFAPYDISNSETPEPGDYRISVAEVMIFGRLYLDPRYGFTPYAHARLGLVRQKLSLDLPDDLTGSNVAGHPGVGAGLGAIWRGTGSFAVNVELLGLTTISTHGTTYVSLRVGLLFVRGR